MNKAFDQANKILSKFFFRNKKNTYEYIVGYMKNLKSSIWDHKSKDKIRDPHVVVFSRSGLFIKNKFLEVFTVI